MSVNINGEEFTTFNDIMNDDNLVTPAERDTINFEVALIGKLIEAREQKHIRSIWRYRGFSPYEAVFEIAMCFLPDQIVKMFLRRSS